MAGERIEKIGRILASMDSDICLTPFDEKVRDVLELVWEILKENRAQQDSANEGE